MTKIAKNKKPPRKKKPAVSGPGAHDWRTTDEDEILRRQLRAQEEEFRIVNANADFPVFSNFRVRSKSGKTYNVEIRDVAERVFSCECVDFRINGLGTCKHVEATLNLLRARSRKAFAAALKQGSDRIDLVPDLDRRSLRIERGLAALPPTARRLFDEEGSLRNGSSAEALKVLRAVRKPAFRISQDVEPWLERLARDEERKRLRHDYEQKVQAGLYPAHETKVPLFPYQRDGMLHLAFTERALLADEMGLGKTIQAIAACALLHRIGKARRVLVVTPASLKTEWEEQIQRFTGLPYQVVFGARHLRLKAYTHAPFFTLVNYEQMLRDVEEVNARLQPDVIVLDEAQRIKNWSAKTTQSIKRLQSRYAFVLTGTPIENRIDELRSLVDFLDPSILGPLFRFNRDFYELDERGRPAGYRNLETLRRRVQPVMMRRLKSDVETELPERTDLHYFVPLSPGQADAYHDHEGQVARLRAVAKKRPLTKQEQDKLMRELAMMRMICDTNYILDPDDRACPKLDELDKILDDACSEAETKVVVFSEWERMLQLVRDHCDGRGLGYAWHTGSVPQRRRRAEIQMFKNDRDCRLFLSTDSGGVGLNLQNASVVVNCDLPWNPARLEQRIARAWRKHQTRAVTVVNLVSENTIEHRMLGTLEAKKSLADGVLDGRGDLGKIRFRGGAQAFMERLEQILAAPVKPGEAAPTRAMPTDRAAAFAERAADVLRGALVACEERFPMEGPHSCLLVVVDRDAEAWSEKLQPLYRDLFGPGAIDPLAPVNLQVIDRATAQAMKALESSGLISSTTRVTRHLYPGDSEADALSAESKAELGAARDMARRKLKAVRLLVGEGLAEEAVRPLREAVHEIGRMHALRLRLPPPATPEEALAPHLLAAWGDAIEEVRGMLDASEVAPLWVARLDTILELPGFAGR